MVGSFCDVWENYNGVAWVGFIERRGMREAQISSGWDGILCSDLWTGDGCGKVASTIGKGHSFKPCRDRKRFRRALPQKVFIVHKFSYNMI
jgi:hypothetical protein